MCPPRMPFYLVTRNDHVFSRKRGVTCPSRHSPLHGCTWQSTQFRLPRRTWKPFERFLAIATSLFVPFITLSAPFAPFNQESLSPPDWSEVKIHDTSQSISDAFPINIRMSNAIVSFNAFSYFNRTRLKSSFSSLNCSLVFYLRWE